jgi:glycosyltransferase involved in cell wall biosynthesis
VNIVYANTANYDHFLQQRPHHIFKLLSERGHQIHWVDVKKNPDRFRTKISENLIVYHDWEAFCRKFKNKVDVLFCAWSHRWKDIDKLNPKIVVYDSLDLFPQNEAQEKNMVDKADVILTTTKNLYEFQKQHTDKPIYMCENGCFNSFRNNTYDIPEDLKDLPKPWVLFSGALAISPVSGWIDIDLIESISRRYTLIVVGCAWGLTTQMKKEYSSRLSKVKFLGSKEYLELQKYYANCDVNIVPFKRCQTSDYSYPLKLIEGCNMGKICVSTDIPIAVELQEKYPNAILISKTNREFTNNIQKALEMKNNQNTIEECFALADECDWEKKVDIIEKSIKEFALKNNIEL